MQEIRNSNPSVVTETCDPNKSQALHHLKKGAILPKINSIASTDT